MRKVVVVGTPLRISDPAREGVKLCPNHFRPVRTMRMLGMKGYVRLAKGTVIRDETLERWTAAAKRTLGVKPAKRRRGKKGGHRG